MVALLAMVARGVIFKVTVKSLMFRIVYFKIGELATTVLGGKRAFLHVDVLFCLFLFLGVNVASTVSIILVIE